MSKVTRSPPASTPSSAVDNSIGQSNKRRAADQGWVADAESDDKLSLESAVKMLIEQFQQTNAKIDFLSAEVRSVKDDMQMLKSECVEKFRSTDVALITINKKVDSINQTVDNLENRCELTIRGIPLMKGENLSEYFRAICKKLTVREPATHIRRITTKNQTESKNGLIVVEFSLKNDREDFFSAYLKKMDLKLRDIGINSDHRIFVNENLTVAARKLKTLALDLKRAGKLSSVFTKRGVVHVTKTSGEPSAAIYEEEDLKPYL